MTTWTKILQENPGGDRTLGLGTLACLEWGPDGRVLATGGSAGVVLWDIRDRRVLGRCALEIAPIAAIAFAADGKRLAALGDSGQLVLCDVARPGAPELACMGEEDEEELDARRTAKLAFSPDGALLLVMGEEHAWLVQDGCARRLTGEDGALGKEAQAARVAGFSSASEIVTIEESRGVLSTRRPRKGLPALPRDPVSPWTGPERGERRRSLPVRARDRRREVALRDRLARHRGRARRASLPPDGLRSPLRLAEPSGMRRRLRHTHDRRVPRARGRGAPRSRERPSPGRDGRLGLLVDIAGRRSPGPG